MTGAPPRIDDPRQGPSGPTVWRPAAPVCSVCDTAARPTPGPLFENQSRTSQFHETPLLLPRLLQGRAIVLATSDCSSAESVCMCACLLHLTDHKVEIRFLDEMDPTRVRWTLMRMIKLRHHALQHALPCPALPCTAPV